MLGISLLKTLPIREYILTDCHYKVLDFLRYNLKINFPSSCCPNDEEINQVTKQAQSKHESIRGAKTKVINADGQIVMMRSFFSNDVWCHRHLTKK